MPAILWDTFTEEEKKELRELNRQLPTTTGLIIVQYQESDLKPIAYWDGNMFLIFDPERTEDPKTYYATNHATKWLMKAKELAECEYKKELEHTNKIVGIAFWIHPEADYEPLAKYENMVGSHFPGSPRR